MTTFKQWLEQATEYDKREAHEYRHHFPVEQRVSENADAPDFRRIVCGCDDAGKGYVWGEGEHTWE